MGTAKDLGKNTSRRSGVTAQQGGKQKRTKTVEVVLAKQTSKDSAKGKEAVKETVGPANALTLTRELIVNPPEKVLRPFREAAKRNRNNQKLQAVKADKGKNFLAKQPAKGKKCVVDLRVHAPGTVGYFAAGGMPPGASLARLASAKGVDVIGVADYYNAEYVDVVQQTLGKENFTILPSLVVCCRLGACHEVFLLLLFRNGTTASELFELLDELQVPKSAYGNRNYCLSFDLGKVISIVERRGGTIIPSRCDKTPYRQLALPTLIEEYGFHTFDLAHPDSPELFRSRWPNGEFTFLSFSSATALGQIGNRVGKIRLGQAGFDGIQQLAARRA